MKKSLLIFFASLIFLFLIFLIPAPTKAAEICTESNNGLVPCGKACKNPYTDGEMPCGSCVARFPGPEGTVYPCESVDCRFLGEYCKPTYTLKCPCQLGHVFVLILRIYNFIVWTITPILAVMFIVIGGALLAISGANPRWRTSGWSMIKWSLLAAALIFSSWLIIDIVLKAIGYTGAWNTFNP